MMDFRKVHFGDTDSTEVLEGLKRLGENMTPWDRRQQMISFVIGGMGRDSDITREEVEEYLNEKFGPVYKE